MPNNYSLNLQLPPVQIPASHVTSTYPKRIAENLQVLRYSYVMFINTYFWFSTQMRAFTNASIQGVTSSARRSSG